MKLLVATRNDGKLREIRGLLDSDGITVVGLAEIDAGPPVAEDSDTFLGNARKKAHALSLATGLPVLADDSGLAVEALGGAPGVRSARFAGAEATDEENNRKLLRELAGVPPERRSAAFVCAMVLALPEGGERFAEGRLEGRILDAPRGAHGFGYDPLFLLEDLGLTLAEVDLSVKNRLSHRAQALNALRPLILEALLRDRPG